MLFLRLIKFSRIIRTTPNSTTAQTIGIRFFNKDSSSSSSSSSSSDSDSDDDRPKRPVKKDEKKLAKNEKLDKMIQDLESDESTKKDISIPKAGGRKYKNIDRKKAEQALEKKPKDIFQAAEDVANLTGEDKKKTSSELLAKLLNHINSTAPFDSSTKSKEAPAPEPEPNNLNISELLSGMKIDGKSEIKRPPSRAEYVRKAISVSEQLLRQKQPFKKIGDKKTTRSGMRDSYPISGTINLFGEEPLGIFTNADQLKESPDILKTWSRLEKKELELAITHPPRNYFEKMILWTEQGKIWKFPIDNEQGLDEEAKVDFSEHIFLEQHLEPWCPTKGPIRHFMELVCVGLSKNPHNTVQEKKEHILWYRDYFEQKKDILKDLIVQKQEETEEQKKIK